MSDDTPRRRRETAHTPDHGRLGGLAKAHGPNHPEVLRLREQLAAERAERLVREVAASMPPLSPETRARLAEILAAPTAGEGAA